METAHGFSALETIERKPINIGVILEKVRLRQMRRYVVLTGSLRIMVAALQIRRDMVSANKLIGQLEIETDQDRTRCKERSKEFLHISEKLSDFSRDIGKAPYFFFSSVIQRLLDEAACFAEDASETLSLAASLEFRNLLEQSLAAHETP